MATAFERWEQTLAELAKNKAKPEDVEKARIALRQKVIEKARQEDPDNSGMALALSRFDNGTRAQSYRSGLVKEPDVLTEDERSGVDHPVLGGIKQAAKELVATQAQGWQRIAGSALRLANDFGENEKGTWLDRAATSMEDAQKSTDEFAGEGYATADGIRGFGKMGLQNAPILISTYLTGSAAAGATSLAGRAAGLAKTAKGAAKVANAARWAGAGGAAAAGFSGEYGDARQQTLDKFKDITPEQLRESEKYAARFKAREKELYLAGAAPEDAAKQAYEETVDALSETDANIVGVVNSLIEFAAPGASKFFLGGGKLSAKSLANAKKFVNLDDVKDVSKQFLQEFGQEGFTSVVTDDTRAKAMNEDVNWGQVGKDALVGGTLGAIMGGGAQFATGQSTRQRALAEVKAQEQQQGLDAQLGQAAQARKAELDAIRQQRPLTPEEQEDADVADAILARNAPEGQPEGEQQPPVQDGQPVPQPTPDPAAGAPIVGATPQPAGAPVGSNIPQPPEPQQPAPGLSGVVQRHTQSAAPALDTVFGDAIKGNQVPDFTGLAQQTGLDRNALVDQFNAKRTEHVRKQGLMDLAEQGDLNALRSAASEITVDPQQQDQLIEEAVAGNEQRKASALAASQQQDAQAQQQAQQSAQQQADKDKYDQTYSKMLDEAVAALEGGQTEVKTFLPIKKKYSASGLNATDVNGVIDHAKQVIAEKQQKAARHEQAVTEAMPHLQSGDEASAVLAMEQAGVTDDADVQSVLKEANKRIRQDSKKPAGTQSVPAGQQAAPVDQLSAAVAEVKAAQAAGKKVNLATIAKKHGVPILDVAKGVAAKPEQAAPKAKPSQPLALPAPQGPATTGDVMVSRNGKVMSQAEADALDAASDAEKKQMRRDMAEEAGNPTGIPTGMKPKVEKPARTEQKSVLPHLILRTDGKPFPDEKQANRVLASKKLTETHEVVSVDGGKAIALKSAKSGLVVKNPATGAEVGVDSIEDAARKFSRMIAETGADPAGGMDVFDASTGQPVANVKADGTWKAVETREQARERSERAVAMLNEEQARKKAVTAKNQVDPEKDDILTAIAKLGGIDRAQAKSQGIDPADFSRRAGGIQFVFRKNGGKELDRMAEALSEMGYPVTENGDYTVNALLDSLDSALRGNAVGTPQFHEAKAQAMYEEEAAQREIDATFDSTGNSAEPDWLSFGADDFVSSILDGDITPNAVIASELAGIENERTVTGTPEAAGQKVDANPAPSSGAKGIASAVGGGTERQQKGKGDSQPDSAVQDFGLKAQTEAERLAEEQGVRAALDAKTKADEQARLKAQADKDVSSFTLTGSNRPADVAMAAGQNDLFAPKTRGHKEAEKNQYADKIMEWDQKAAKWGKAKIVESARSGVASNILGRDFAESADSFYAKNPSSRATRDWLYEADGRGVSDELAKIRADQKPAQGDNTHKTEDTISDADYAQVVEAAKYLKDIVYSLDNLLGDDKRLLLSLSSPLGKSGRDTILMDTFGIDRNLAHTIHNRMDDSKPHKLRDIDMTDALDTFPMLKKIIDDVKEELRLRDERKAAKDIFAPQTRGEKAEKAASTEPVKWFGSRDKAEAWIAKNGPDYHVVQAGPSRFEVFAGKKPATPNQINKQGNPARKRLGVNYRGETLYEDEMGVRSYATGGVLVSESMSIIPGKGIERGELTKEYKTADELAAEKDQESGKAAPAEDLDAMFDDVLEEVTGKPKVTNIPKASVESAFTGEPDPKNSAPMQELGGFAVGDKVSISGRSVSEGVIRQLFTRQSAVGEMSMARVDVAGGKSLDLLTDNLSRQERTAGQAAVSAAKNTGMALGDAIDGLGKLFGGNKLSSGLTFDEDTYAKAKPYFIAAIAHLRAAGGDLREAMRAVVKMVVDKFGADAAGNMKPYVVQFIADVRDGNIDDPAATLSNSDTNEATGNDVRKLDTTGQGALEGVPSGEVQGAATGRGTGSGAAEGGRGNGGADGSVAGAGGERDGGVGNRTERVPVSGAGAGGSGRGRSRSSGGKGRAVSAQSAAGNEREPAGGLTADASQPSMALEPGRIDPPQLTEDFIIEDDLGLGEGGQRTKYKNNVEAIRLIRDLEATGRTATTDEQKALAKYVGWGGIPQAFDPDNKDWSAQYAELKSLLSADEWDAAFESTQYAHYTSREIINGMYAAVRRLGFTGGNVLEAGGGVGNFIGLMPVDLRTNGKVTLVEREAIAAAIAKHLYPRQNIRAEDFTEFGKGQDGQYDMQIGNPPFSSNPLTDKSGRKHLTGLSVHNYFITKGVDMLRDGGIMAVVVSNSFMDAGNVRAREYIAKRAKLLGAIRLPNNAFSKNANTQVTTDIIFLQKLPESDWNSKAAIADGKRWVGVTTVSDPQGKGEVALNQYFADNMGMMLGVWGKFGTMYGPDQPALVARPGQDTAAMMARAVAALPEGVYTPASVSRTKAMEGALLEKLHDNSVGEGGFYVKDGKVWQRVADSVGEAYAAEITPNTVISGTRSIGQLGIDRLRQLAELRRTMRELLAAETEDRKADMDRLRKELNTRYDAYTADNGRINDPTTKRLMRDDPDYPLIAALEMDYEPGIGPAAAKAAGIKPQTSKAKKAAIFDRRVIEARKAVTKADSPQDAINISMAERGRLDAEYIGRLLDVPADEVLGQLASGTNPLLFRDPATDEYVLRDAYLSGNVREKLKQAKAAGLTSNARALEEVQPEDIPASKISVRIGSPWVPVGVYADFAKHLFGEGTKTILRYVKSSGGFSGVIIPGSEVMASTKFGTKSYHGDAILLALMNNRQIKVMTKDGDGKPTVDAKATEEANSKADDIKQAFQDWVFKDSDRAEALVRAYNDANNNYVVRKYDGSWLKFPGKVPDAVIRFRRHQRNAIARTIQDRTTLYDHVVGAGKTFTAIASAMEMRRMGLIRKPLIVVPNHLVGQWASDFYRLYPGAKVLAATKKDFERENRRRFLAKIASGDWDAVIIAHSSFERIRPSAEFEQNFIQEEIDRIMREAKAVDESEGDEQQKKRTVKQLAAMQERLENRIAKLREKPMDDLLDFQQIGVDQLFVDEAHCFPAYAKVITDAGVLTIGEIVENRLQLKVLSVDSLTDALEWKQVTDWFKNSVTHFPVRIHHEGGAFECTANHKIWTYEEGFVEAGSLTGQHTICLAPVWASLEAGGEALRDVRNGVQLQVVGEGEQRQEAVLLEPMRGDLAHDAAAHQGRDHPWVTGWAEAGGGAPSREERPEIVGAHDGEQPDAQPGVEGKNGVIAFREDVLISRREQQDHDAAIDAARGDGASNGVLYRNGAGQEYVQVSAELLQSGFGSTGQEDCHRGGWQDAQAETMEAAGCKEDGSSKRARVVCVEVLERGSDGQFAEGFRDDQSVYCLEVEDNHNFFADGVLVSNSFKNLMFTTKMQNVRGLGDPTGSQRAYDMYIKTNQIMDQNGRGQGVAFMTGTPVSNSLAEMYHMMRYLMPTQMRQLGFESFDAWANTYASVNQVWMQTAGGDGFKAQNRMSNFDNVPELLRLFDQVSDTVTMDDIKAAFKEETGKDFPLPKLLTGRRQPVSLEKTPAQEAYMKDIIDRLNKLESRKGPPKKGEDNHLTIMSDARKAAMDIRLVDMAVIDREKGARVDRASDEIFARWQKHETDRGTQLVFADLGTPISTVKNEVKEYDAIMARIAAGEDPDVIAMAQLGDEDAAAKVSDAESAREDMDAKGRDWISSIEGAKRGFSVYDDLKKALMEKGIPENQIAFIHSYNTDDQKAALFRKVNSGEIRILMGSTAKMGAGTNVQKRLVALHHLDVPWKPSDLEQREGRIIRQGNELADKNPDFEVEILAYVTKDTLDMRMWQIQEVKLKMINQLRTRSVDRELENAFEDMEMSAGEMQAAATGNMDMLREIQLRTEVQKLEKKQRAFDAGKADAIAGIRRANREIEQLPAQIATYERLNKASGDVLLDVFTARNKFKATINGKEYTNHTEAAKVLRDLVDAVETGEDGKERKAKLDVAMNGEQFTNRQKLAEAFARLTGDNEPFVFDAGDGKVYRVDDAADAVMDTIASSRDSEGEKLLGNMGDYKVSIEYGGEKLNQDEAFEVHASLGDDDLPSAVVRAKPGDDRHAAKEILKAVRNMVRDAGSALSSLKYSLEKAKKNLADLSKIDTASEWPDSDKLARMREEHRALRDKMNKEAESKKAAESDDSPRMSTQPENTGPGLTTSRAREILSADPVLSKALPFIDIRNSKDGVPEGAEPFGEEGYYHNGRITLFADNINATGSMSAEERLKWVAFHEVTHRGVANLAESQAYLSELERAGKNPFIKNLAKKIHAKRQGTPYEVSMEVAIEEALAEANAALQTGRSNTIKAQYGLHFPLAIRGRAKSAIARFFEAVKRIYNKLTGRGLTNEQVGDLLRKTHEAGMGPGDGPKGGKKFSAPPTPGQPPSRSVFASVSKQWMFQKWTETLGTQLNTAMLEPLFKPTYQLVQRYLQHTSNDAYDAISVAPNLLGRLEDVNDYKREIKNIGKFRKINADRDAAAVPLFEGTRFDKKVYSDAVLKRVYNLTDDQVAVYREARAAIEASLDSHAKSVITKILLDSGAVEFSDIDTLVNRDLPADDYMEELRQRLDADILAANDAIAIQKTALSAAGVAAQDKASIQASIKKGSRRVELLEEAAKRIDSTEDTLSQLKREGYFPLMRWGKYTVTVKDAGGNVVDFRMVETLREKAALSEALTKQYQGQGMAVTSGTMDEGRFKDFRGMSPETLALFAKELGVDNDEAYQEYLKLALPGQSALKRRIHRKGDNGEGIAGFSMDIQRTLASFVMGNARHSARNIYGSAITKSVDAIPGERGDVRGLARNLAEFVTQPDENSTSVSIRNMLFVWNMGASVAFGALNLSQPWMMTLPWLSQFSGVGNVAGIMGKASKTAAIAQKNGTVPQEYYAEYQQAVREGHVDPQNVFMLQGIERGGSGLGSSLLKTVSHGMGMIAAATESYNRKLTLFAALDVARAKGLPWLKSKGFDSAYAFAVQAVAETQGVYNKGNRPTWARGPIGAVLLVFKQYAVNWIEMAVRMGRNHYGEDRMRKGLMMMLGLLFAMAGAMGMPGAEDLKDIVETAMGSAGKPVNIERQMQMTLGKGMADAVMAGPMNALVLNSIGLDMHGRMSMGNIFPGTGAFNPYTSTDAKLSEGISVMGAGTGLLKKGSDAVAAAQDGRFLDAAQSAAPRAVESIMKGVRMMAEGKARDARGNVLMETTPWDAAAKIIDFQPASVAISQRERGRRFQDKNIQMVARSSLRNRLITAYEEKDAEKIRDAERSLDEWNQDNPLYQIKLKKRDLRRAAKKRGASWLKREETPKGLEWMDEYADQENGQ